MRIKTTIRLVGFLFLFPAITAIAGNDEFLCNYTWPDQAISHSVLLDVQGEQATIRGGIINDVFSVGSNTDTELLIYQLFTKENAGPNYPVGFTTMSLDKQSKNFVYSNSFAGGDQNNHAKGTCAEVQR